MESDKASHHYERGKASYAQGDIEAAKCAFYTAWQLDRTLFGAAMSYGVILYALNEKEKALAHFLELEKAGYSLPGLWRNIGNIYLECAQYEDALAYYKKVLEQKPSDTIALVNAGAAASELNHIDEGIAYYQRAISIKPDLAEAHNNLAMLYLSQVNISGALHHSRQAFIARPDLLEAHSMYLFLMHYDPSFTATQLYEEACNFAAKFHRGNGKARFANTGDAEKKLRIGFVSGDFREHAVAFFLESFFAALRMGNVEIYCYVNQSSEDNYTERLKRASHYWRKIYQQSDQETYDLIQKDRIDILIDLAGYTLGNRLSVFALKPAPLQVTWLGYFDTTGLKEIDYIICDSHVLPTSNERYFSEAPLRLPDSYLCFSQPDLSISVSPPPVVRNGYITFGSFNKALKISNEAKACWAELLRRLPTSRLFLKTAGSEREVTNQLIEWFVQDGIDRSRITIAPHSSRQEHMEAYRNIDIALDPFPYNGGTTTIEALWMGVPVIALCGNSFLSRVSTSILANAGLAEWVCREKETYIAKALSLAQDVPQLTALRGSLRERLSASAIFDAERFANYFELAMREIWREWCRKGQKGSAEADS